MGPLSGDLKFNVEAHIVKKNNVIEVCVVGCEFIKRWPTEKELEMPDIL